MPRFTIEKRQNMRTVLQDGKRICDLEFSYAVNAEQRDYQQAVMSMILNCATKGIGDYVLVAPKVS